MLKKRIFLYEFVWTEALIKHVIQSCNEKGIEICGWAVRRKDMSIILNIWPEAPIFEAPIPVNLNEINYNADLLSGFTFEEEQNISFLLDREGGYQNNMHSNQVRYQIYTWVENIINVSKPDWLLFPDVPHNIFTYLLYLCGKRRGIQNLIIRRNLALHLFTLSGNVEREFIQINLEDKKNILSPQTAEYLKVLRFGKEVLPIYMKEQRKNSKPFQILKRSLSRGLGLFTKKSVDAAFTYVKRRQLKKFYESLCDANLQLTDEKPYVAVFLHLQPERTTMPEGGAFAQQWLMVQMLASICASLGWNVYVKEHPSTFMFGPKLYRGKWFYDGLKVLPNVHLISTKVDSGLILKNAKVIATVTGTVGIEAVAKGIPALLFGESPYIGCAGTFRIKTHDDLQRALLSIQSGVEIKFEDIEAFFAAWEQNENCHNTGLDRTADHNTHWLNGKPQTAMFSKMIHLIEKENSKSF